MKLLLFQANLLFFRRFCIKSVEFVLWPVYINLCWPFLVYYINKDKQRIIEGELRATQLVEYLESIKSPKNIFLSEDGSGVIQKIVYDVHSNQLVGLVLPFKSNGMPKMFSFEAKSTEDIEKYLQMPKSTLVYIIVAQPLKINASPFILQIFGTDNKFETADVLRRWAYTEIELNRLASIFHFMKFADKRQKKIIMYAL